MCEKTRTYVEGGVVDPNNLILNTRHKKKIYELSEQKSTSITDTVEDLNKSIFQQHPMQEPLTATKIVDEIFNNNLIKLILNS
jgi:hypothetical protein